MDNEFDREQKIIVIVIERCVAAPPIKSVCVYNFLSRGPNELVGTYKNSFLFVSLAAVLAV